MSDLVLVTCGEQRSALAIVRSLGKAGYRVAVCASRTPSLAAASRYVVEEFTVPDPVTRPESFSTALAGLVETHGPRLLFPVTEAALLAALPLGPRFPETMIPFADANRFAAVCDKTRVFEAARDEGIPVPKEVVLRGPEDLPESRSRISDLAFPAVIKPARSVSGSSSRRTRHGVVHVADRAALEVAIRALPEETFPVHVQQRIVGPGVGVFLLIWDGRLVASFAHRRLREKPPSGGVSVYRESIALEPALLDRSRRLLSRFDWDGVAMVEYKLDAATGEPYLMEINGRFWGSLELAIASGVDFPSLLAAAALGEESKPVTSYTVGLRSRWVWGDVDHLIARLRRSAASLSLPSGSPGRLRTIGSFLAAFAGGRSEVFRFSDPGPAFRETREWFSSLRRSRGVS